MEWKWESGSIKNESSEYESQKRDFYIELKSTTCRLSGNFLDLANMQFFYYFC